MALHKGFKHPIIFMNHVRFRKYIVLERLSFRQNGGQIDSKKHKFS
jgi:hypothetical protein